MRFIKRALHVLAEVWRAWQRDDATARAAAVAFFATFSLAPLLLLSFGAVGALFSMRLKWRHVAPGALGAAFIFTSAQVAVALYFDRSGVMSAYGGASSILVALVMIFVGAAALLAGAELTDVLGRDDAEFKARQQEGQKQAWAIDEAGRPARASRPVAARHAILFGIQSIGGSRCGQLYVSSGFPSPCFGLARELSEPFTPRAA